MNLSVHFLCGVVLAEGALIAKGIPLEPSIFLREISNLTGPLPDYAESVTALAIAISSACCIGSVFPDIDIWFLLIQHRTLTHWPVLYVLVGVFALWYSNVYLVLFCLSALIHLALDSLTPMGIPLKYPFGKRFSFFLIRSDSFWWNFGICVMVGGVIYIIYSLSI